MQKSGRHITRRQWMGGTAALCGGALAAACGGAAGTGGGTGATPAGGLRSGTTITFFQGGTPVDVDSHKEIFTSFQQRYPQLKVQQVFNATDNDAKVQAAITAGTPPDVF